MIEQIGQVERVDGTRVWVACRPASCRPCDEGRGCGGGILARAFARQTMRFAVDNPLDVRPGERVVLGLDESDVRSASFRLYGLPVLAFLAGTLAGTGMSGGGGQDLAGLAGGLVGMAAALAYARRSGAPPDPVLLRRCLANEADAG